MAKQSKGTILNPISVNIKMIDATRSTTAAAPTVSAIFEANSNVKVLIGGNSYFFMDNLSKIPKLSKLPQPYTLGNNIFATNTNKETLCLDFEETSTDPDIIPIVITPQKNQIIDGGKVYEPLSSLSEEKNFGNLPVSNRSEYNPIGRGDLMFYDYPGFAPRGWRKIPSSSADTLCGPFTYIDNVYTYDRLNYNWLFGNRIGIDFNPILSGATPIPMSGSMISQEGCATMSSQDGELLFYTNGETVYTRDGNMMLNGDNLGSSGTSTQSSIIVPQPDTNKYFIFTTDYDGSPNAFEYAIVNMNLGGGAGVVETKQNILISHPLTEKVTACCHATEDGYWVITHTSGDSRFFAYHVTSTLLVGPVVSTVGSVHNTARGYMKTSLNSEKLVSLLYDEDIIEVFDFDATGGTVTNPITLTGITFDVGPYGLEFSSDSSKYYVSDGAGEKVYQFDLTYTSATEMVDNMIEVASISGASLGALQMGPDEKIYLADIDEEYLHVIHYPNGLGVNCNFQEKDFYLTGFTTGVTTGYTSQWGLPNVVTCKVLSCDRYIYVSKRDRSPFLFDVVLNDVSKVIQPRKLNVIGEIYKYNVEEEEFADDTVVTFNIPYTDLTPSTTYPLSVPLSQLGEGQYIMKLFYEGPIQTLIANQLGYTRNNINTYNRGTEYGKYDPIYDWYMLNMFEADVPGFYADTIPQNLTPGALQVSSQFTRSDFKGPYTINTNTKPIVALGGAVLAEGLDYSASTAATNSYAIELFSFPPDDQVLTFAYLAGGDSYAFNMDIYTVTAPISSGPTGDQGLNKFYYNTDEDSYEFYIEIAPSNVPIVTINGAVLGYKTEYLMSETDPKRIIIFKEIPIGALLIATYIPKVGIYGALQNATPNITWTISNAPTEGYSGQFTVEVTTEDDIYFENIQYFATTDYVIGKRNYDLIIDLSGETIGWKGIYRIKNEKTTNPLVGETISSVAFSDSIPIEIIEISNKIY